MTSPTRADWYDDPFERFEQRYHDGTRWTKQVSSAGVEITDPSPIPRTRAAAAAPPLVAAPTESPVIGDEPMGLSLTPEKRRQLALITIGLGSLIAVSSLLTWASSNSGSVTGLGLRLGYVTAACGIGIALYGRQGLEDKPVRHHRWITVAITLCLMISGLVSSVAQELDDVTLGYGEVEVGTGAVLTLLAALVTIWPRIVFHRDFRQRLRASRQAAVRNASMPASSPLPPGIPPAPR